MSRSLPRKSLNDQRSGLSKSSQSDCIVIPNGRMQEPTVPAPCLFRKLLNLFANCGFSDSGQFISSELSLSCNSAPISSIRAEIDHPHGIYRRANKLVITAN